MTHKSHQQTDPIRRIHMFIHYINIVKVVMTQLVKCNSPILMMLKFLARFAYSRLREVYTLYEFF